MWAWSTIFMMRGVDNTISYCDYYDQGALTSILDEDGNVFQPAEYYYCVISTKWEVFRYNYFVWTTAFFFGLQFTYLKTGILKKFILDWRIMKTWPASLWVVFVTMCIAFASLIIHLFYIYYKFEFVLLYITYGCLLGTFFVIRSNYADETHIHHYVVSLIMMSFIGYQSYLLTIVHGVFNGVFIEGASHWGLDPIWITKPKKVSIQVQGKTYGAAATNPYGEDTELKTQSSSLFAQLN